jgi:LacI family transcriptional regulator
MVQKRVNIRDVAARAGVSVGTVSRVINRKPVSAETLALVNRAMREIGFTPSAVARSMRTRSTLAVGFVINDISNMLFATVAKAAEKVLQEQSYSLLIANTDNDPARERLIIESLIQRRVDGLMIAVTDETDEETRSLLRSVDFPVTLLDREMDGPFDSVCDDHAPGMRKAIRYLFDLGHRDIGLITGANNVRPGRERARGFREAFAEQGRDVPEKWLRQGRLDALYGYAQAFEILSAGPRPTALVAGGNQIFAGVLRAIRRLGLVIPRDLSVISCDDVDLTVLTDPPVTVISRNLDEVGRVAAEILLRRIRGNEAGERHCHVVPTELILRESCTQIR